MTENVDLEQVRSYSMDVGNLPLHHALLKAVKLIAKIGFKSWADCS